jgi:phenylpropionate dioxygenase-like ring-hydroxylating dioxygenase large terminal subunit
MEEQRQSASREDVSKLWPRYFGAKLGFPNYWYPTLVAKDVKRRKPVSVTVAGEKVVVVREQDGKVYGLRDRCPHRGVPLSLGRCEFAGMLTCSYHGWTYELKSGELIAALTDGPDSPICGKSVVRVKNFPVEERAGIIWVFIGDGPPPPVEDDIPHELLAPDAVIYPMVDIRKGDWRHAMENAVDPSHGKYLHRKTPFFLLHQFVAYQTDLRMVPSEDGKWLRRKSNLVFGPSEYPGLGQWPHHDFWRRKPRKKLTDKKGAGAAIAGGAALPAIFFVGHEDWQDFQMFVPVDENHHMTWQISMKQTSGIGKLLWSLRYWTYIRHLHHVVLNRWEDGLMVENMNCPPERLFRPDAAIVAWRRWCEEKARRWPDEEPATASRSAASAVQHA